MADTLRADVDSVARLDVVPKILDVVCGMTCMSFAAVARATKDRWIACAVRDDIALEKRPYELLVRWDQSGALQGAHVIWATTIIADDGSVTEYHPGVAEPPGSGVGGFPLADVIVKEIAAALEKVAPLLANYASRVSELEAERDALRKTIIDAGLPRP